MPVKKTTTRKSNLKKLEANGDQAFFVRDGQVVTKLGDLAKTIQKISDDDYWHHVNEEHNDFANWVRDVFKRKAIANKIQKAGDRKELAKILRAEV